ncbi:hypothetical protein [Microscilla marina]|uniref:Uncharacterized protein n=1 Tax=Microscilla marina ATCC 23134 TaxID=313606 RepID=A1ZF70_MICM2|nr:hypothetical protein [Microscilla marina]EAY31172.1 hypothetical protein M23134_07582 [Microscilla marina ATCC 23134]
MSNEDFQILQLIKQLLQQKNLKTEELGSLSRDLSHYGSNDDSSSNETDQNVKAMQERIEYLEEQLDSTIKMAEMTINGLAQELSQYTTQNYSAINNEQAPLPSSSKFNYLGDVLFTTEHQLQQLLPQSFFLQASQDNLKGSFVWAKEKMGLVYLIFAFCEGTDSDRLQQAIVCNHLTNTIVLESHLIDVKSILNRVDFYLTKMHNDRQQFRETTQYGVCVIDKINSRLDYIGSNMTLLSFQQDSFQEYTSPPMLGSSSSHSDLNEKQSLQIQRGSRFYVFPQVGEFRSQAIQKVQEIGHTEFVTQKEHLNQWLNTQISTNNIHEYFISGFGF